MKDLLQGLKYLASLNIMHRDLKPENMILEDKGELQSTRLKIVDMGLASDCDKNPYLFNRCGTPGFVAPEIINSNSDEYTAYTPKVDVFSAGVIFYIMLIGKSPFKGSSFSEILDLNREAKINFDLKIFNKNPIV